MNEATTRAAVRGMGRCGPCLKKSARIKELEAALLDIATKRPSGGYRDISPEMLQAMARAALAPSAKK